MAFQNSDLLAINRGGVNYQVTWGDIVSRQVLATDLLMLQRGGTIYHVPIGEFWNCTSISDELDFYLAERNLTLYGQTYKFPCAIQFSLSDNGQGISTTLQLAASPVNGNPGFITYPDGTQIFLSASSQTITLTQPGTYTVGESFTEFKFTQSDSTIDASLTPATVWNDHMSGIADFGAGLFTNVRNLSGVPSGLQLRSLDRTFEGTSPTTDIGVIDTSVATSAVGTFLNSDVDSTDNIDVWDTSNVTNMSRMFEGAANYNGDISTWDVANVTDMSAMFKSAISFNQDLEAWGAFVGNVTNMNALFSGAGQFNGPITTWDTSNVKDMNFIFDGSSAFNQDIGDWDVGNVASMDAAFRNTNQFNQDLTEWCVNLIPNEPGAFDDGSALQPVNQPVWGTCPNQVFDGEFYWTTGGTTMVLKGTMSQAGTVTQPDGSTFTIGPGNWTRTITQKGTYQLPMENMTALSFQDQSRQTFGFSPTFYTGALTTMYRMFYNADKFDNSNISGWDTRNVTNMAEFAKNNGNFDTDLSGWDTSNVTNMFAMFNAAFVFNQDLNSWNTSSVVDISCMFSNAKDQNQVYDNWDVSKVTNMAYAFFRMDEQSGDPLITNWNISNATNLTGMFSYSPLINPDLSGWDTSNVSTIGFNGMFRDATSFNSDVSNFVFTKPNTYLGSMFRGATAFNQDISMWDMTNVTETPFMFENTSAFNQDISSWNFGAEWRTANNMFLNATAFNQDISNWCAASIGSIPTSFDTNSGFEGQTAIQPQWGECPFPGSGNFTITDFQTSTYLRLRLNFHDGLDGEIVGPSGPITTPHGTYIQLTELGTYTLPMGSIEVMSFRGDASSEDVLFDFAPDFYTGSITNMYQLFLNCKAFNGDISNWDTSQVTRLEQAFLGAESFSGDISGWDTKQVTLMSSAFRGASAFNAPVGTWDVSNVQRMDHMFHDNLVFNQPLLNWDVSNVKNMSNMFRGASVFNQYLNPWDVSGIPNRNNMANMFYNATAMEGDISNWCVPQISPAPIQFSTNAAFENNDALLPDWGVCTPFNGIYLEELVGGVGDLVIGGVGSAGQTGNIRQPDGTLTPWSAGSFANKFTQLGWYEIENMEGLEGLRFFDNDIFFDDTSETAVFRLSSTMDTSGLTETRQMFRQAFLFNGDVSMIDTSSATNMAAMFRNARTFDQDISHFDTSNATNMSNMFHDAYTFNGNISQWNTAQVAGMTDMFNNAAVFNQDLSGWCVPLIGSIPTDFDTDSGFVGQTARQPGWGGCPSDFTLDTDVVIGTPTGVTPVLYNTVISITTDATTTPANVPVLSSQWQRSADGGTTWTDIDGETGLTYTVAPEDRNVQIRLVQELQNGGTSPVRTTTSNVLTVENAVPAPESGEQIDIENIDTDNEGYHGVILHQPTNRMWFTPFRSEYIVGIDLNDFTDIVSHKVPNMPGIDDYRFGGSTILPNNKIFYAPYYATPFAIFDPEGTTDAERWTYFGTPNGTFKFSGALVSSYNDTPYAFPYRGQGIWQIDYVNATASVAVVTGSNQYGPATEGPDQRIYLSPGASALLGIFDPSDNSFQTVTAPLIDARGYPNNNGGISVASNNSVYIAAGSSSGILKLDFNTLDSNGNPTMSAINIDAARSAQTNSARQGKPQLLGDGRVFFPPLGSDIDIVILDPTDDSIEIYPNNHRSGRSIGGNQLPDGKIFSAPYNTDNKVQWWETYQVPGFDVFSPRTNYQQ